LTFGKNFSHRSAVTHGVAVQHSENRWRMGPGGAGSTKFRRLIHRYRGRVESGKRGLHLVVVVIAVGGNAIRRCHERSVMGRICVSTKCSADLVGEKRVVGPEDIRRMSVYDR